MKKIVAVSLLALTSLMAFAEPPDADWGELGKLNGLEFYADKTSYRVDGPFRSFLMVTNFSSPVEGLGDRPSMIAKYEYDCSEGRMRVKFAKAYSEHYGRGKPGEVQQDPEPWGPVPATGLHRTLFKKFCNVKR